MTDHYSTIYDRFHHGLAAVIRRETFGEDLGQTSWLTADDFRRWLGWLALPPDTLVLEIGSGSGGPALFLARTTGARIVGVDVAPSAVAAANKLAADDGMAARASFQQADAAQPLPFADATFDAIVSIDALNHLADRAAVFADWRRILRPGGRLLVTDPYVVTGILGTDEIALRALNGPSFLAPAGENERLLAAAGFTVQRVADATDAAAHIASRRRAVRERYRDELIESEGLVGFDRAQRLYQAVATLAAERRLSRFVYLADH